MSIHQLLEKRSFQIAFFTFSALLIFLGRQADNGLLNFDDSYYAQKAKEILHTGNFWVVTFAGQPDFEKPPLHLWLTALFFGWFGISGYCAVLTTALMGCATLYVTYRLGEEGSGNSLRGFMAVFVLLCPGFFVDYARRGMTDITLTFFVALAMYGLWKGREHSRWYWIYGLSTAAAILAKSVLGLFPLIAGALFVTWSRGWRSLFQVQLVGAVVMALAMGFLWHGINWARYGEEFTRIHWQWILWQRFTEGDYALPDGGTWYFIGYVKELFKNYQPWFFVLLAGLVYWGKKALRDREDYYRFLITWIGSVIFIMSLSRSQYLRYLLAAFPAMALLVAETLDAWLSSKWRSAVLKGMVGILMAVTLFLHSTPFEIASAASVRRNSSDVRALAEVIRINSPEGQPVVNYRLPTWDPRNSFIFYTDRLLDSPLNEPEEMLKALRDRPEAVAVTSIQDFRSLEKNFPGKLYLIQAEGRLALFCSISRKEKISYDFSHFKGPAIK